MRGDKRDGLFFLRQFAQHDGLMPQLPENPTELAQFGSLELIARQLVEGLMMGRHRSPFKGSSVEFVEHRDYYPGDEIRHIDWRAYGKTDMYYVKEFEDETDVRSHLLVDVSGSMGYPAERQQVRLQSNAGRVACVAVVQSARFCRSDNVRFKDPRAD